MKKFSVIALVAVAAMLFAGTAMAIEADFSGHYRVRGYWEENTDLYDQEGSSNAAMDQRLRIDSVFKVSDTLRLDVRWEGVDNEQFSTMDATDSSGTSNFTLERVWMTADFDMFTMYVGRMVGGMAGTAFGDTTRITRVPTACLSGSRPWPNWAIRRISKRCCSAAETR